MFQYFTREEANLFTFYRIPKELISNPKYDKISIEAKFLYGLLLDRNNLSIENEWYDDNGYVYIYYSREEVAKIMRISKETSTKIFSQLKEVELIREVRQGLGKPNIIYVSKFTNENETASKPHKMLDVGKTDFSKTEKPASAKRKNRLPDSKISDTNNTDINNTNFNNNDFNNNDFRSKEFIREVKITHT